MTYAWLALLGPLVFAAGYALFALQRRREPLLVLPPLALAALGLRHAFAAPSPALLEADVALAAWIPLAIDAAINLLAAASALLVVRLLHDRGRAEQVQWDGMESLRTLVDGLARAPTGEEGDEWSALLELACTRFGADTGLVVRVEGDARHRRWKRIASFPAPDDDAFGAPETLAQTPVSRLLATDGPLALDRLNNTPWNDPGLPPALHCEAFLGCAVPLRDGAHLALAFLARDVGVRRFTGVDRSLVQLLCIWGAQREDLGHPVPGPAAASRPALTPPVAHTDSDTAIESAQAADASDELATGGDASIETAQVAGAADVPAQVAHAADEHAQTARARAGDAAVGDGEARPAPAPDGRGRNGASPGGDARTATLHVAEPASAAPAARLAGSPADTSGEPSGWRRVAAAPRSVAVDEALQTVARTLQARAEGAARNGASPVDTAIEWKLGAPALHSALPTRSLERIVVSLIAHTRATRGEPTAILVRSTPLASPDGDTPSFALLEVEARGLAVDPAELSALHTGRVATPKAAPGEARTLPLRQVAQLLQGAGGDLTIEANASGEAPTLRLVAYLPGVSDAADESADLRASAPAQVLPAPHPPAGPAASNPIDDAPSSGTASVAAAPGTR